MEKGGRQQSSMAVVGVTATPMDLMFLGFGCMMNDILCFKWLDVFGCALCVELVVHVPGLTAQQTTSWGLLGGFPTNIRIPVLVSPFSCDLHACNVHRILIRMEKYG